MNSILLAIKPMILASEETATKFIDSINGEVTKDGLSGISPWRYLNDYGFSFGSFGTLTRLATSLSSLLMTIGGVAGLAWTIISGIRFMVSKSAQERAETKSVLIYKLILIGALCGFPFLLGLVRLIAVSIVT